ncbi:MULTISPECIES: pyrroline-5-carboxylate reductase [Pseudothermotoga]|jgi:pyrroline-5-carboxylate reductase|uniref:Pyrroline-5-carboxylate reductase n=1 Tax=Pseudothermotoga lettingae (strain ATCC BAA-301 / DSM 14385 / NBRC 107922 / TMO) TaxID=416591 RepID=A8F8E3_PSELT|nr:MULTISPECIES: pyrroline-5-carboxylate reductase [Pseudothermotoga]ABV34427.1 pyrroline-5-carboxylate reductase [Pseudothermotoga lettingae TMO]KUK21721.1 MAG: Pyrroline-5-carboxylate reductase [Pseudothermotoga lettingae]MDK2883627.1 pyrroline-5-carboxylate reductase [Pseudothermotoga sp.]GLI48628.1 pyrroline-5-carboxylate reductase [Pseudothermotoga lettingae TMO]HBJ81632.1 pyrroline-5-carboxylate reductase [Pseudothermotoga sp.]
MVGVVGVGNIGSIIVNRLVESGIFCPGEIILSNRSSEKLKPFLSMGCLVGTNEKISKLCDLIFLCVKPQDSQKVFSELREFNGRLIISTMTAISIDKIFKETRCNNVVRIMPNIPAKIGKGVVAASKSQAIDDQMWNECQLILSCLGKVVEVEEYQLAAVTALSGSAPAFIFVIIEALIDAGIRMGLSYEISRSMILETMIGSAELLSNLGNHPGEFRHVVTSPSGTTIEGIYRMEREGVRGALMKTIQETYLRALQIEKDFGN